MRNWDFLQYQVGFVAWVAESPLWIRGKDASRGWANQPDRADGIQPQKEQARCISSRIFNVFEVFHFNFNTEVVL